MHIIRTLIAYDDKEFKDKLVNLIKTIDGVQIVGIAENGKEAYEKIIQLKPEMIFLKFDLREMNGLEIIKAVKENLKTIPIYNIISDKVIDNELKEMIKIVGANINSFILEDESIEDRIKSIYKDYKEYKK